MWEPQPGWQSLPAGSGATTVGVWRTTRPDGSDVVVKRIAAPQPGDGPELTWPTHSTWWRREAEIALGLKWSPGSGLVGPDVVSVDEDPDGVTIVTGWVRPDRLDAATLARCLGRFAAQPVPEVPWLTADLLGERVQRVSLRGGWQTLARTAAADLADAVWARRSGLLERYRSLPHGPAHGDATAHNLIARRGADVVGVDWQMFGAAPHGCDLGYLALSSREGFDTLAEEWLAGHGEAGGSAEPDQVRFAAAMMAGFTALTRADWALAQVAGGEGPLAAKFGHPGIATHLRALQRQAPLFEVLLG